MVQINQAFRKSTYYMHIYLEFSKLHENLEKYACLLSILENFISEQNLALGYDYPCVCWKEIDDSENDEYTHINLYLQVEDIDSWEFTMHPYVEELIRDINEDFPDIQVYDRPIVYLF